MGELSRNFFIGLQGWDRSAIQGEQRGWEPGTRAGSDGTQFGFYFFTMILKRKPVLKPIDQWGKKDRHGSHDEGDDRSDFGKVGELVLARSPHH